MCGESRLARKISIHAGWRSTKDAYLVNLHLVASSEDGLVILGAESVVGDRVKSPR